MSKPKNTAETLELGMAKLASSGLTIDDANALGIEFLDPSATQALHKAFKPVPSLRLNYYNPFTNKPSSGWSNWPAFYRLRYLKNPTDFASLAQKKPPRYVQEPDSGVCAYFPRLPSMDWPSILADDSTPLIITEGEFKAAKACISGYPTIGLGGVHNFKSAKLGVAFLDELEAINWVKRWVYIIYDSDFKTNPAICSALNDLAEELRLRGAVPNLTALPDVAENGEKTGLDDFLLARPVEDLGALLRDASQPLTLARGLWKLNDQVTYVCDPGLIIVHETQQKVSPNQFREHAFSSMNYAEQVVKANGAISLKPTSAAAAWLNWPMRREVGRLTYAPGRERLLLNGTVRNSAYNTWPGWNVVPKAGDVAPFEQLLSHLFGGSPPAELEWFKRWLAYPLQYPGVKMFSSAVLHGRHHGTGKSLVGVTLGRIYGSNYTLIKQKDLHGNFNEWAERKQFVLGDDITGSDSRTDADVLKTMITQTELRINIKFVPTHVLPDCINYLWTSNQPDAFFLEDDDRRFFIHEVVNQPMPEEFYVDYTLWMDGGGSAAVFDYLLNLDLGDFNPAAPALRTNAKERMTADVRSDLGSWVRGLLAHPDAVLKIGDAVLPGDLFTNRQLLRLYDPGERTRTTANGLGRELRRAGAAQVLEGAPVKTADGQDRYYVLRHPEKWQGATREQVVAHLAARDSKRARTKF